MNGQNAPAVAYDLKQAKEDAAQLLLYPNRNVVGIGLGKRVKVNDGKETLEDCVRIYAVTKIAPNASCAPWLSPQSLGPPDVHGVPTDVIEVGRFGRKGRPPQAREDTTPRPGSPIRIKTSAPNVNQGHRGTLGAVVTDGARQYILSCNHVLAVNGRVPKDAAVVSAQFVGTEDTLAKPGYFIGLERNGGNAVDCAMAPMTTPTKAQATFPDGLALSGDRPADPVAYAKVTKFGAVTGRTYGTVVDTDADLYIDYSFGMFRFEHQFMIDGGSAGPDFATAGDSGSLVVDTDTKRAVAMIFAASGRFAVACPLTEVFQRLEAAAKLACGSLSLVVK